MATLNHVEQNLKEVLEHLGLSPSEMKVFSYLLESARAERISIIARKIKLNRTTLYGVLKALSTRGLVSSVEDRGILAYRSIQPHLLVDYIERAKEKLSMDIAKVRDIVPLIEQVRKTGSSSYPSIQFFDGTEGIKQAYEDTIKNNPSKTIFGFTGTEAIFRSDAIDMEWVEWYMNKRAKAGVKYFTIAMDGPASRIIKARDARDLRVTKLLPPGYSYEIEMSIYENKVLIASFGKDHPLAVLIEDEKIGELMKSLFKYIDSTLKE